jgi:hypothetical protein
MGIYELLNRLTAVALASIHDLVVPAARARWGTRFSLRAASWPLLVGELRPLFRPPLERSGGATNGKPANAVLWAITGLPPDGAGRRQVPSRQASCHPKLKANLRQT